MQDRSRQIGKVLLQRTAGPYISGHFVRGYTAVFGFSLVYNYLILKALTPLSRAKSPTRRKFALNMFNLIGAISATRSGAKGAYLYCTLKISRTVGDGSVAPPSTLHSEKSISILFDRIKAPSTVSSGSHRHPRFYRS
jgi:hypothetical protein